MSETKTKISRRDFLKVLGAGSGLAASGCAEKLPEKIIPYVIQPDEIVPGVASWYAGYCPECPAGCGTLARVREGRAVKLEGNPEHPVNRGALCAHGQSLLQAHYDPDRVREPLQRAAGGAFKAVTWEAGVAAVADAIKGRGGDEEVVLITGKSSGSIQRLIAEFGAQTGRFLHFVHDISDGDIQSEAARRCFGRAVRYNLAEADVIAGFGAGYLEYWQSPVEYARQWAERRSSADKSFVFHVEPRLSLTAANADRWLKNAPGTETILLAGLLKLVLGVKGGAGLGDQTGEIERALAEVEPGEAARRAGVEENELREMAKRLVEARTSLVLAGGASVTAGSPLEASMLANLLNAALGNVGKTVLPGEELREGPYESYRLLNDWSDEAADGKRKIAVVIVSGVNPLYSLPAQSNLRAALLKAKLAVAVNPYFDETSSYAHVILPLSSHLESWSDSNPRPGIFNLNQPSMQPLYRTQTLGDTLLAIGFKLGQKFGEAKTFVDYIRDRWRERTGSGDFEKRWLTYVERGGEAVSAEHAPASLQRIELKLPEQADRAALTFLAYPSLNSFDGRTANRPWMQELPNPLTSAVWGSWIEMHPTTAERYGLRHGKVAAITSRSGAVEAPVFVTQHIHPELLAMPIGQGHELYGRYAQKVGANPLRIMSREHVQGQMSLAAPIEGGGIRASYSSDELVTLRGHDSQEGRGLIRSIGKEKLKSGDTHAVVDAKVAHGHGGQELGPQPEPKQMYRQMEHPLYHWGMSIDLSRCIGCSACVVACYAENNVPVVGKELCARGREMSWLRIETYFDGTDGQPASGFLPMLCQHCNNAPCEPVCPVYATYHNEEGLNSMIYNRCVGTRYCSNNCPYKVRRFNWFDYDMPEPLTWQLNPDVTVRNVGIMEKCTFCVQRIAEARNTAKNEGRLIHDGEVQPACASACPTKVITFGNLQDKNTAVSKLSQSPRAYRVLDQAINTQPAISYLARVTEEDKEGEHERD